VEATSLLTLALRNAIVKPRETENGKEGIEQAQELQPELIVLDLSMPVMNGLDAARVLKRLMPTVRLIMYCEFGGKFAENQARLIGIAEVVSKAEHAVARCVNTHPCTRFTARPPITIALVFTGALSL